MKELAKEFEFVNRIKGVPTVYVYAVRETKSGKYQSNSGNQYFFRPTELGGIAKVWTKASQARACRTRLSKTHTSWNFEVVEFLLVEVEPIANLKK